MAFLEHVAVESNLLGDAAIVAANHTNEAVPTLAPGHDVSPPSRRAMIAAIRSQSCVSRSS